MSKPSHIFSSFGRKWQYFTLSANEKRSCLTRLLCR